MITNITANWVDEVMKLAAINKVAAIKEVRQHLDIPLREAKELIEHHFDSGVLDHMNIVVESTDTPGYWINRIFVLANELAVCYDCLEEMGFPIPKSKKE
jgi:hypothetical protein